MPPVNLRLVYLLVLFQRVVGWTAVTCSPRFSAMQSIVGPTTIAPTSSTTRLAMGLMDSLSNFLTNREGDFVKLDSSDVAFGPGPLLIAYGIPDGIDDEEIQDMIADGAPQAAGQQCQVCRVSKQDGSVLDLSLETALQGLTSGSIRTTTTPLATTRTSKVPVLFFSGFQNDEMLTVYNILGREIYEETGGQSAAACAKAVPNAMGKPLRQVLEEISGDHKDALAMDDDEEEEDDEQT